MYKERERARGGEVKKGPDGWMDKRGRGLLDLLAETRYKRLFWGRGALWASVVVVQSAAGSHSLIIREKS